MGITLPISITGFTPLHEIGRGATARVWLYEQHFPKRFVAVKISDTIAPAGDQRQFIEEANCMAQVSSHPHILTIYAAGISENNQAYLILEHAIKGTYLQYVKQHHISLRHILEDGVSLCSALATAHRQGIIHRDIKPSNILVTPSDCVVLADFGIAYRGENTQSFSGYSRMWAAPEVRDGRTGGTCVSDIYSLAATLFSCITGLTPREFLHTHTVEAAPRYAIPEVLRDLLMQAMHNNPEKRPQSAVIFARQLQHFQLQHYGVCTPLIVEHVSPLPQNNTIEKDQVKEKERFHFIHSHTLRWLVVILLAITLCTIIGYFVWNLLGSLVLAQQPVYITTPLHSTNTDSGHRSIEEMHTSVPSVRDARGSIRNGVAYFSWSNPDAQIGDSFAYLTINNTQQSSQLVSTQHTHASIPAETSAICIQIWLIRSNKQMSDTATLACAVQE